MRIVSPGRRTLCRATRLLIFVDFGGNRRWKHRFQEIGQFLVGFLVQSSARNCLVGIYLVSVQLVGG